MNCVLERHHVLVAHPVAEQVGREARVAQLADVRARVGETEQHGVLGEQPRDRVGIVVGEHARETRLEILLERHVEHEVEGRAPALLGDVDHLATDELRVRIALGDEQGVEVHR